MTRETLICSVFHMAGRDGLQFCLDALVDDTNDDGSCIPLVSYV